jgi:hypothetical protein
MMKELPDRQEWKVPIKINVSTQPLYLKVILPDGFPVIMPQIQIMSRVTHQYIE